MLAEIMRKRLGLSKEWEVTQPVKPCSAGCGEDREGSLRFIIGPGILPPPYIGFTLTADGFLGVHTTNRRNIDSIFQTLGIVVNPEPIGRFPCTDGEHTYHTWHLMGNKLVVN